ncbi:uncharacterized protein PB18E9.04c-like [Helianthus annuus]|uniref:uncharacterized protein PB18E9.04c-like n=1 Tax=Helianthus annuus TaxID=4232 RepID=UPI0016533BF5|nr:uncharacterized protein PB18E9.04c-like [Helianthus annuus]
MELNEQGISEPKDDKNPEPKRKNPTRKVREPKHTPSRPTKHASKPLSKSPKHQSSTQRAVVTPAVSTTVGTSVVSAGVRPKTTTSTTTTAPPNIPSPPRQPSPPAKMQKTSTDTSVVVMATSIETPVVSTAVSQSPITSIITFQSTITPKSTPPKKPPAQEQKTSADTLVALMTTVDETPVVSTPVSQNTTTTLQVIFTPIKKPPTNTSSPNKIYTRKSKFQSKDEDVSAPVPLSSVPYNVIPPQPFIPPTLANPIKDLKILEGYNPANITPIAATYPLELEAVKNEMRQFYTEDDSSKRRFPSLIGFRDPANMDEYLKLKARQADMRARFECKDQGDKAISERMQFLLTKVRQMEDYARDLSKEMSNLPPEADLQKEMRKDYLAFIMKEKFYPAKEEQFSEWPLIALKHEVNRIERIKNDPGMKRSAPN